MRHPGVQHPRRGHMKIFRRMTTGVLLLLLAALAPAHAWQQDNKDKPKQDKPERQQQEKGRPQQEQKSNKPQQQPHAQQQQQDQNKNRQPQQTRQQQANRPAQQRQRVQHSEQRQVWQQHRASNWQSEHRDWQQRGGYHGYRIPQARYGRYFGPSHSFRVYRYPFELYGGSPRFQYGGFWFGFIDPYPE